MNNLSKIKNFSHWCCFLVLFLLMMLPFYYLLYWAFINFWPQKLIMVNTPSVPLIPHPLPLKLQTIGFVASLFPLSALIYGLLNIRRLFFLYKEGEIFSFKHVKIFKNISKAFMFWACFAIVYESVKSILFSVGNPPGSRVVEIGISSGQIMALLIGIIIIVIAWVMDEGRLLIEEQQLTV